MPSRKQKNKSRRNTAKPARPGVEDVRRVRSFRKGRATESGN